MNKKALGTLLVILAVGAGLFIFNHPPCSRPIAYSLGEFDTQFGVSKETFLADLKEAETIWEKSINKELFVYEQKGKLKVNLIYDSRQQATSELKSIGSVVSVSRTSYDTLRAQYESLNKTYLQAKADYETRVATFNAKQSAYDQEVDTWNAKGGAPKADYDRLQNEKRELEVEVAEIQTLETNLNGDIDQINSLARQLNSLADSLNLNVQKYNQIGASRGEEFTEGEYVNDKNGENINIYEFDSHAQLVRLLAHELGHALGLQHVADSKAIMYKLNISTNSTPTAADLAELKAVCQIK